MPLSEQLSKLRGNIVSEEEEFAQHIKTWMPIAILIGIIVGLAMSLFTIFTSFIAYILGGIFPLLAMAIGGLLIWLMVRIGFEDPSSNGISYVISKKHQREPVELSQSSEFLAAGVSIGSGLPVGREGPALIIGSALASVIARWRKIPEYELHEAITIGSAAATGALFQAPFGSAVFAAEVPYKEDSDEPMLMISFLASVVAAVTLRMVVNLVNDFGFIVDLHLFRIGPAFLEINIVTSVLAFSLGIIIGLGGRGIIDFYHRYQHLMTKKFSQDLQILVGLLISLVSLFIGLLFIDGFYLAEGISSFDAIAVFIGNTNSNILFILFGALLIQIIATIAIIAVGFPGGIFSPTLSIGALSGIIFATVLGISNPFQITAYAIVGMSASHAAFTKTPIASILLVLEITSLPNLIIPIILANISAYVISGHRSLYKGQIRSRDANLFKQLSEYDQFNELRIEQLMTRDEITVTVNPDMSLINARKRSISSGKRTLPVVDVTQKVLGVISLNDINSGMLDDKQLVEECMTTDVVTVKKKMSARQALYIILNHDVERAPVVNDEGKLEGIVTQHDILLGHQQMIQLNKMYTNQR